MTSDRFAGQIAGAGSTSGVRIVVGRWTTSPFGTFADVMVAAADGTRTLLAPDDEIASYVASTYTFDEVVTGPVTVSEDWQVTAPGLTLQLAPGRRTPLFCSYSW